MRVAIFTESYYEINGVGRTYRHLADYARKRNFEVDIYINGNGTKEAVGSVNVYNIKVDVPIEYYPGMVFDAWSVPKHIFHVLPDAIDDNFRTKEYDVVMLATQGSMGLYALTAAKKYDLPLVGSYHTNVPLYAEMRMRSTLKISKGPLSYLPKLVREATSLAEGYYYRKPLYNLAPTNIVCDTINERYHRPTRIFRRGVDIDKFHPSKGKKKDGKTVLFVSRISVEKNVDKLIGFGRSVPGARLVIVGDGPERERLERDIPEARFKGFLTGETLNEEFASADIFVFPSITETYGNVVQEAMASGLPVVLDSRGPSSELVRDGVDGFHYSSKDEMFRKISELMMNDELRVKMSKNAREAMEQRTWEEVFDSLYMGYDVALDMYSERPMGLKQKWRSKFHEMLEKEPLNRFRHT